jgi:hypothetical protein
MAEQRGLLSLEHFSLAVTRAQHVSRTGRAGAPGRPAGRLTSRSDSGKHARQSDLRRSKGPSARERLFKTTGCSH